MSWRHDPITDLDLMAYADGQLDAARRQTVEAHLAATPTDAAMVEAIMAQNAELRASLSGIAEEQVPERLKAVLERDPEPLLRPLLKVASVLALMATSGLGGWWLGQGPDRQTATPPAFLAGMAPDLEAIGRGTADADAPVAAVAGEAVETPMPWLADQVALTLAAPSLGASFVSPELDRLVDGDGRPTIRFKLAGPEGRQLDLYLQTRKPTVPADVRLVEAGAETHGGTAAYWQDGPLVWALTGDIAGQELVTLARTIAMAIELEPNLGAIDAELTSLDGPNAPVQLSADDPQSLPTRALPSLERLPIELIGG
jgi:anti-sigma factor RsiW